LGEGKKALRPFQRVAQNLLARFLDYLIGGYFDALLALW